MRAYRFLITILLVAPEVAGGAEVLACRDPAGLLWFTDRPCVNAEKVAISTTSVVSGPTLTMAEQRTLSELARQQRPTVVRRPHQGTLDRDRACQTARDGLDALRDQRRRGYALAAVGELDARERALRVDYERNC